MAKLLSELPVGALVKDTSTTYNGEPIIWRVLEHGHDGDPNGSTTLEAKDIISLKCFDAREPSNSNIDRQNYGNNRYAYSNLLQWLNSNETNWYTAKHQTDQAPDSNSVYSSQNIAINPYDTEAGFLTNFSSNLRNALLTVTKRTALPSVDGGGYENVESKLFLLSNTEVGFANENDIAEGSIYNYYSSNNTNDRRKKNLANNATKGNYSSATSPWYWWLRTPFSSGSYLVGYVSTDGSLSGNGAYSGSYGVSPAFCLLSSQKVSGTTDSDGAYVLEWNAAPTITNGENDNKLVTLGQSSAIANAVLNKVKAKIDNLPIVLTNVVRTQFTNIEIPVLSWEQVGDYYRASISVVGVTSEMVPTVIFSLEDAEKFSPVAEADDEIIYIYAYEQISSTITIPLIYCDLTIND